MFDVGDVITGTLENGYGVTTRGVVCKVVGIEDCEPGEINVEIISVDEELVKESRSSYMRHHAIYDEYIGHTYIVHEEHFEYYEPKAKLVDSSELIDFIDGM